MKELRECLRDLLDSGLSQSEIAKRCGLTQPTISRLLSGVHSDTRSSVAVRIFDLHRELNSDQRPAA